MKVYQVYNQLRSLFGGEAAVIDTTIRLLKDNGHSTRLVMKSSRGIEASLIKKFRAFWGGVYNIKSYYEMQNLLRRDPPDLVHVHGVYPNFSPSVLVACRQERIPIVYTVHNHILTCPNWYHLYKGAICEVCSGGHEYRCVLKNCRGNILESCAYALRSSVARSFRLFHDNLTLLIALTEFAKAKLINAGFRDEQIEVISNSTFLPDLAVDPATGKYIAFAGRLSHEKGVDTLLSAAERIWDIPVKIAGDGPLMAALVEKAPPNVELVGMLDQGALAGFYGKSRFSVVPSFCYEQLPLAAIEAMALGLPVIASRLGGLPEVVEDGVTGLLFEAGNPQDLAEKMLFLWGNPALCRQMGIAGRAKAIRQYSHSIYHSRLIEVYEKAIRISRKIL